MSRDFFLVAALTAAGRGWFVFPLVPNGKTPALREWERWATTDRRQVYRWWAGGAANNIGVATGGSGLVVLDLDDGCGQAPPARFAGARNGRDALAMIAAVAGAGIPADTYEVTTPGGGSHLYFRAPAGLALCNTAGSLGWKIDSRAHGGYCVAAGSVREQGVYRVARDGDVAELPGWLAHALTPVPQPASCVEKVEAGGLGTPIRGSGDHCGRVGQPALGQAGYPAVPYRRLGWGLFMSVRCSVRGSFGVGRFGRP